MREPCRALAFLRDGRWLLQYEMHGHIFGHTNLDNRLESWQLEPERNLQRDMRQGKLFPFSSVPYMQHRARGHARKGKKLSPLDLIIPHSGLLGFADGIGVEDNDFAVRAPHFAIEKTQ